MRIGAAVVGVERVVNQGSFDQDIVDRAHVDRVAGGPAHFAVLQREPCRASPDADQVVDTVLAIQHERVDDDVGVADGEDAAGRRDDRGSAPFAGTDRDA